jgi:hypothetical protein
MSLLVHFVTRYEPKRMTVELSGTPGLKIAGIYRVDGRTVQFSGVTPTNIVLSARHLQYSITNVEPDGRLTGELFVDARSIGASGTPVAFGGVAGEYVREGSVFYRRESSMFTTVSPER